MPKITVLMSVYNDDNYVREAVESILNQTFTEFEFIIVDDGSTDRTWPFLSEYAHQDRRILLIQNQNNIGLTKSLNKGLSLARGTYIARQDSDDVSLPNRLMDQITFLQEHQTIGLIGSAYHLINSQGDIITTSTPSLTDTDIRWHIIFDNSLCHTSVMFRRQLLKTCNTFYNEAIFYSQDYELWARILKHTKVANLPTPLVKLRVHGKSISNLRRKEQQRFARNISFRQLKDLIPELVIEQREVDILRSWFKRFPCQINKKEMNVLKVFLKILEAFEKQRNIDKKVAGIIRQHCIDRILDTIILNWKSSGLCLDLLLELMSKDMLTVLFFIPRRGFMRIRRIFTSF